MNVPDIIPQDCHCCAEKGVGVTTTLLSFLHPCNTKIKGLQKSSKAGPRFIPYYTFNTVDGTLQVLNNCNLSKMNIVGRKTMANALVSLIFSMIDAFREQRWLCKH